MVERAALWAARLATDEATQADHEACEAWCDRHRLHRLAMERMRGLNAQVDNADCIGRKVIESVIDRRSRRGRRLGGVTFAVVALIGGGWLAAQSLTVRALFPDYETARGELRMVTLADGSGLTIDTDAALSFDSGGRGRTVTLFRGQILARVARDPAHPFMVATRDGTTTALGTAFIVRRDDDATTVAVIESHVRACPGKSASGDCTDLGPGDRVRMTQGRLERLDRVDPQTAGIWAEGWLAADDRPVSDVLLELNRYRRKPVRFDPAELNGTRISGSFPLTDTDRALVGILEATGLRLSHSGDGDRVHRAR